MLFLLLSFLIQIFAIIDNISYYIHIYIYIYIYIYLYKLFMDILGCDNPTGLYVYIIPRTV